MILRMPFRKVPTFFLEGMMNSFPLGYLRTFCPRKSKPCSTCVMTVFVGESSRPRSCRNCSMRRLISPSSNSFEVWVHCPRASNGLLPRRSNLVGYVRWDARSDQFPPCQTIIPTAFRSQSGWPTVRPECAEKVSSAKPFAGTDLRQIEMISQVDLPAWVQACLSVRGPCCVLDRFREPSGIEESPSMAIASARRVLQTESTSMCSTRPVRWLSQNDEQLLGGTAARPLNSAPGAPGALTPPGRSPRTCGATE